MPFKIANAPCSWGIYYPQGNQLTGAEYLDAVTRAGYRFTELGPYGFLGAEAQKVQQMLDDRGLTLTGGAHVHTLADAATAPALRESLRQIGPLLADLQAPSLILMDESEWYGPGAEGVVDEAG